MFTRNVARAAVGLALCISMGLAAAGTAGAVTWNPGGTLPTGTFDGTATALPGGGVLYAGGANEAVDATQGSAVFAPLTRTWASAGTMPVAHSGHTATQTTLANGHAAVIVAGGVTIDPGTGVTVPTAAVERYDAVSGTWLTAGAPMPAERINHAATVLADGRVFVVGGDDSNGDPLSNAVIYDPVADSWTGAAGTMTSPREGATATLLADDRVLVAGGFDGTGAVASADLYDPATDSWAPAGGMGTAREFATATALPDGTVLVAGGDDGVTLDVNLDPVDATALTSAELYTPGAGAGAFAATAPMGVARSKAAAALVKIGGRDEVLVTGGHDAGPPSHLPQSLATAELYDIATPAWTAQGAMVAGRARNGLAVLTDGRTVAVGGLGVANATGDRVRGLAPAELFTPPTVVNGDPAAFGSHRVGTTTAPTVITFTNAGPDRMFVTAAAITGPDRSSFTLVTDGCTNTIVGTQAGQNTCAIEVAFNPHLDRALGASLTLTDNTDLGTTAIALSGTGLAPRLGATGLGFGAQTEGTVSATKLATITNTGTADLRITDATLTGAHFLLSGDNTCLNVTVAPGATCQIGVRFAPQSAGAKTAAITLTANTIAGTSTVAVDGTGVAAPAGATTLPAKKTPSASKESFRMTCRVLKGSGRRTIRCVVAYTGARKDFSIRGRLSRNGTVVARSTSRVRGKSVVMRLTAKRRLRTGRYSVVLVVGNGNKDVKKSVTVR